MENWRPVCPVCRALVGKKGRVRLFDGRVAHETCLDSPASKLRVDEPSNQTRQGRDAVRQSLTEGSLSKRNV